MQIYFVYGECAEKNIRRCQATNQGVKAESVMEIHD